MVKSRVEKAKEALEKAQQAERRRFAKRTIECLCREKHQIKDLDLLVTHWYVQPHGCTGGDYYNEGEWQFLCPIDGAINRLMFDDHDIPWQKRDTVLGAEEKFKLLYRGLFKSSKDVYVKTYGYNNYYVDKHRSKFNLPAKWSKNDV